jgi:hypothetical protein
MATLLEVIRDGDQIVSAYIISKDAVAIQVNYPPWAENVETLFDSERDPLAKAGFRNTPSLLAHPAWMTREAAPLEAVDDVRFGSVADFEAIQCKCW